MERKSFPSLGIKVIDEDQGIVEHIITVFGVIDYGKDVSHLGSFKKTISERGNKVLVLDQHRRDSVSAVLGKPLLLREIGRAELPPDVLEEYPEATGGLLARTKFLLETNEGRGAFIRLKEDAVREWSYGYDALDTDFSNAESKDGEEVRVRNLRTVKLYEYSPVLWGMNPATTTISAKEMNMEGKPYDVFEQDGEYCVYKIDEDGNRTGDSMGCHPTVDEAEDQVRALYAAEEDGKSDSPSKSDNPDGSGDKDNQESPSDETGESKDIDTDTDIDDADNDDDDDDDDDDATLSADDDDKADIGDLGPREQDPQAFYKERKQSLFALINKVMDAFFEQFGYQDAEKDEWYWVKDVHDSHIMVEVETSTDTYYYKAPYSALNDEITFSPKDQWVRGRYEFVPDGAEIMQRVDKGMDNRDGRETVISVSLTIPSGQEDVVFPSLKNISLFSILNETSADEAQRKSRRDNREAGPVSPPTSSEDNAGDAQSNNSNVRRLGRDNLLKAIDAELSETDNLLEI